MASTNLICAEIQRINGVKNVRIYRLTETRKSGIWRKPGGYNITQGGMNHGI
jgi:hypothetical protein